MRVRGERELQAFSVVSMTAAMSHVRVFVVLALVALVVLTAPRVLASENEKPAAKKGAAKKALTVDTVKEMVEGEDVRDFRTFCNTWMQKLADRTSHNASHIAWTKGGPGVVGEYVSYGTDRTCIAKEEPGKAPIGKITYREIKYRKEGASEAVAQSAAGTIVEQTDVTEIFRFAKGRWQY